jgi:hypothetical protein
MNDSADSYCPSQDWIPYVEAQRRVLAGLPVEVLDPYSPEWRITKFTAHKPLRHYRIPIEPPQRYDFVPVLRKRQTVRVFDVDGNPELTIGVPEGTWQLSLLRVEE